jgi:hypothetical protein
LLSDWLQPAGQLLWGGFFPDCPGLVVSARHAKSQNIGINKKIRARQDFKSFH